MKINREKLLDALGKCSDAVYKNSSVQSGIDCFYFKGDMVHAYGMDVCISHKLDFETGCFVVNADLLLKLIKSIDKKEIDFKYDEKKKVVVVSGSGMKSEIKCMLLNEKSEYVIMKLVESVFKSMQENDRKKLPEDFVNCVSFCNIKNNLSNQAGLYCDDDGVLYACSNSQVMYAKMKAVMDSFYINDSSIKLITKGNKFTEYSISENWIHLYSSNMYLSVRKRMDYKFPLEGVKKHIIGVEKDGYCCVLPESIKDVIKRSLLFCDKQKMKIDVTLTKKGIRIFVEGFQGKFDEYLDFKEEVEVEKDFKPIMFSANPEYFESIDLTIPFFFTVKEKENHCVVAFTDFSNRLYLFVSLIDIGNVS